MTEFTSYVANLNQTGTNAPVDTVLFNNTEITITWIRGSVGNFDVIMSGDLRTEALFFIGSPGAIGTPEIVYDADLTYDSKADTTSFRIETRLNGVATDGLLTNVSVKIELY